MYCGEPLRDRRAPVPERRHARRSSSARRAIPADGYSPPGFPAERPSSRVNPEAGGGVRAARAARACTPLSALGIRPPGGFELAFTNNPALRPERTRSFDAGVEQTLLAQPPVARRHLLLQPLLRPDRDAGRLAGQLSHYQVGQPGQLAGAGRGVLGAAASGALAVRSAAPTRYLETRDPLARRLERPGAAAVHRGTAVDRGVRSTRASLVADLHARPRDRQRHRLLPRLDARCGAQLTAPPTACSATPASPTWGST